MPFIETSTGAEIYYEETGQGWPLVMLHGWSMSGRVWHFQKELADSWRLIIPDLRGHGRSSSPAAGYLLENLAGDVVALFEQLDLTEAVLLGWSAGSQVALAAVSRLHERLAGLVMVGATSRFTTTEGYPWGLPVTELRGMGLRLRRDYNKTMGDFFRGMFATEELSHEQENRITREIEMEGHLPQPKVAQATLNILASADLRAMLPEIHRPVLIIHGSADAVCPPGAARYLAKRIPDSRLVELNGVGHAPFLSRPVEFNAVLRSFLREKVYGRN
jgi:pimeloyl-[acyl-carrier protein] methyl ester esterase